MSLGPSELSQRHSDNLSIIGDFRFEYECEVDYEYNFSNQERILKITTQHTNIVHKAFMFTDQQQGEATATGNVTGLKFESRTRTHTPI